MNVEIYITANFSEFLGKVERSFVS